jgi:methionyl-tRNA formyltransferase
LFDSAKDRAWERDKISELGKLYPDIPMTTKVLLTESPNSEAAREFLQELSPDMVLVRCKTLIKEEIFSIPADGTMILHPGICPEYRNAHGCFWALANREADKVGMTLLKIDSGIDTGPVYGYYSYPFDALRETPAIIHNRVIYENLDPLRKKLEEIHYGTASVIDTHGRKSGIWGQPWLSRYMKIKRDAKIS